jgi:hypothetical protein
MVVTLPVPAAMPVMVAVSVVMVMAVSALVAVAGRLAAGKFTGEEALHERLRGIRFGAGEDLDAGGRQLPVCAFTDPPRDHDIDLPTEQCIDRAAALLLRGTLQSVSVEDAAGLGVSLEDREAGRPAEMGKQTISARGNRNPNHRRVFRVGCGRRAGGRCIRHAAVGRPVGASAF